MNDENENALQFLNHKLWHCLDEDILVKLGHCSINMADMDRLLSAVFLNDKIINCISYVASALSLDITIQGSPENSTQNPLSDIAVLSTYALQDQCIEPPDDEYVIKFVESLNKHQVSEEELSKEFMHEDPFQEICVSWFATHAFGEIARVLGHYSRRHLVPTKLLCIFNRDVGMHWTVHDIDVVNSVIYEYGSMNQWNAVVHKITPWLAKFLGIYKYQAMRMGPIYFGSKDMIMKSQPMADQVKRNEKKEIESTFAFRISPESSQLPHQLDGIHCGAFALYYVLCKLFGAVTPCSTFDAEQAMKMRDAL
eukprot:scaffold280609_cov55-Attheya_sp.AAC.1